MKNFLFFMLVLTGHIACGVWKLGQVHNYSDLALDSAWYVKKEAKGFLQLTKITTLSDRLKKAHHAQARGILINFDYKVALDSSGCSLIQAGGSYVITFDHLSAYRAHYPKSKDTSSKKHLGKEACHPSKHNYCARVFLEKGLVKDDSIHLSDKPLIHIAHGYVKDDEIFDLLIQGHHGKYEFSLIPNNIK